MQGAWLDIQRKSVYSFFERATLQPLIDRSIMSDPLAIHIRSDLSDLERLLDGVASYLEPHQFSSSTQNRVRLVLEEMITNVIKYGYDGQAGGEIRVVVNAAADGVDVTIEDDGREFDPVTHEKPATDQDFSQRPLGGLGIHLVCQSVDNVSYERRNGRNSLRAFIRCQ